jgi:aminoglycoside phosphotransferase (APT) family kinase protein
LGEDDKVFVRLRAQNLSNERKFYKMIMENYEENNPADIQISEFLDDIRIHWPNLRANDVQFHYHGTYNVFIIKNRYILRIPDGELRNMNGLDLMKQEFQKLKFFQAQLSPTLDFTVPNPLHIQDNLKLPYMFYNKIPGKSLNMIYNYFSQGEKKRIAHQIRSFLDFFHAQDLRSKFQMQFPELSQFNPNRYYQQWQEVFKMAKKIIYPIISNVQQNWISILFNSFLDHPEYCNFSPTISHGDFDTSNIIIQSNPLKISAIIDFEETKIGDPAADLLFFSEGADFHRIIMNTNKIVYDPFLEKRMMFLYCRTCIPYLSWGLEHYRSSMIKYGIRRLSQLMHMFPNPKVDLYELKY